MAIFKFDDAVRTRAEVPARIVKIVYDDCHSEVYNVDFMGKSKALKWFVFPGEKGEETYKKLLSMVTDTRPSQALVWPEELTEVPRDFSNLEGRKSFGYITERCPEGYVSMPRLLLDPKTDMSFAATVDTCLRLVCAFDEIHRMGYCFGDISDNCIFFNPDNGDVRVSGCDKLVRFDGDVGEECNIRFCAPEFVTGEGGPSVGSDLYSMAVIIFMLIFRCHPMVETVKGETLLNIERIAEIYAENPTFIFDDKNDIEPFPVTAKLWKKMPVYIKDAFTKVFTEGVRKTDSRISELDFMRCLVRLRSDITDTDIDEVISEVEAIPCDNTKLLQSLQPVSGLHRGDDSLLLEDDNLLLEIAGLNPREIRYEFVFETGITIPARAKSRVYKCLVGDCSAREALDPIGVIVQGSSGYGLRNKTDAAMEYSCDGEEMRSVQPNGLIKFDGRNMDVTVHSKGSHYKFRIVLIGGWQL